MKTRTLFMGTADFALAVLEQLYKEEAVEVVGIVSQPDRELGRKKVLTATPTKKFGVEHQIPVFQPVKLRKDFQNIMDLKPDLIITCAYGQMIPDEILALPKLGIYNLHGSLLPYFRGGAPIQRAIMAGAIKTGMTLMKTVSKMDAGDMIAKKEVEIPQTYTYGQLSLDLQKAAVELLHENINSLISGNYESIPQDEAQVSFAYNIKPEEEKIDFTKGYTETYNHIRALIPNPVSYALVKDQKIKFWEVEVSEITTDEPDGEILPFINDKLCVACQGRVLCFNEVQLEGKSRCSAKDLKNGYGKQLVGLILH